ncbi:ubiquitin-like protein Pup [Kitasatospora indigofera]|uniref:ubiquitin-like protein Pup n=1 Tax=Kitasatospora indigofera TaxID=67307 RepID=UPI0036BD745E
MASNDTGGGQHQTNRTPAEVETQTTEAQNSEDLQERHEKLSDDVEAVLDEIDNVLESNAEEFVQQYIQKGGQ